MYVRTSVLEQGGCLINSLDMPASKRASEREPTVPVGHWTGQRLELTRLLSASAGMALALAFSKRKRIPGGTVQYLLMKIHRKRNVVAGKRDRFN